MNFGFQRTCPKWFYWNRKIMLLPFSKLSDGFPSDWDSNHQLSGPLHGLVPEHLSQVICHSLPFTLFTPGTATSVLFLTHPMHTQRLRTCCAPGRACFPQIATWLPASPPLVLTCRHPREVLPDHHKIVPCHSVLLNCFISRHWHTPQLYTTICFLSISTH